VSGAYHTHCDNLYNHNIVACSLATTGRSCMVAGLSAPHTPW